jgi:O-antigen/teichoic acid export membrane protein
MTTPARSAHAKNAVSTLVSGSAGVLLVGYLAQPILTRLFSPAAFGEMDLFLATLGLLMPVASLRYEDAVLLPEDESEAGSVWMLALAILTVATMLTAGAVWALRSRLDASGVLSWAVWLAPALFVTRAGKLAEVWLSRHRRFALVSRGQVAQAGLIAVLRLAAGVREMGMIGLLGGYLVGQAATAIYWLGAAIRRSGRILIESMHGQALRAAAVRYRRFAGYSTPSTLLNAVNTRLPFLLLGFLFDPATVGQFGRAFAVMAIPLSTFGAAVSQVFFVEGARTHSREELSELTVGVHRRMVAIGLFPAVAAAIAGPDAMAFFFGAPWVDAGHYVRILAPWLFIASVASPLTRLFDLKEAQHLDFISSLLMLAGVAGATIAVGGSGDVRATLATLASVGTLARIGHLAVLFRLADVSWRQAIRSYGDAGRRALPYVAAVGLAWINGVPWITALAAAGTGAVYLIHVYRVDDRGVSESSER